ncbi:MAG TPA: DUF4159 domain-containing protein [Pirellulaceae bacterium]|nr:DUF4159 domain-containing protein [Pirellulaceae bacterium]HMO92899.1 DUF4159 domain-containing protein [Pirellulaceae bacterium]HMP69177.1 DUF4159 domain-containing protein [Pirellulaceae bacterium]
MDMSEPNQRYKILRGAGAGMMFALAISAALLSLVAECDPHQDSSLVSRWLACSASSTPSATAAEAKLQTTDAKSHDVAPREALLNASALASRIQVGFALQDFEGFYRRGRRGYYFDEVAEGKNRGGVPMWEIDQRFKHDVFTFARVKYTSSQNVWGRPQWAVDYPEADLNFSYRLQEVTSLKVAPEGVVVQFTDPNIFDYPFVYLVEPGQIYLTDAEVEGMRKYFERGGFMMVDDFWGEQEWSAFERQMKIVFPQRKIEDVPLSHEIFQLVYQLKEKPQIPSIGFHMRGYTSDRWDAPFANYRCIKDDQGRIMIMICHNTDTGDGWEREGVEESYFKMYSEKYAYPLGINIVMYALTR